jgi:hypothetical protein
MKRESSLSFLDGCSVIGLLCASAGVRRIPAVTWPIEAAVEALESRVPARAAVRRPLEQLGRVSEGVSQAMPGVRSCVRTLVRSGNARPTGRGWMAGYEVEGAWLDEHARLLGALSREEQKAFDQAGQRLAAWLRMLSKNEAASSEPASATT